MSSSISRCSSCRRALVEVFVSPRSIPRPSLTRSNLATSLGRSPQKRAFILSSGRILDDHQAPSPHNVLQSEHGIEREIERNENGLAEGSQSESQPWYLQIKTPVSQRNPLLERQKIPELPENPPPLLGPLLKYISVDLGLDDLKLLDLRQIDPPPALGANLIMLIGTVRSEKHLHVSAEHCCRWLKTKHRLSPLADGLVGRGELKVKLRRKARRAKMLSRVGASETATVDDGIRTGWICVHIRNVPDGKGGTIHQDLHDDFVGFSEDQDGVNMVIQILTQEKREELDLEDLWSKAAARHERKEARFSSDLEGLGSEDENAYSRRSAKSTSCAYFGDSTLPLVTTGPHIQRRAYYSTTDNAKRSETLPLTSAYSTNDMAKDHLPNLLESGPRKSPPAAEAAIACRPSDVGAQDRSSESDRIEQLQAHLDRLKSKPVLEARDLLENEQSSFWTHFNGRYPLFPTMQECGIQFELLCFAHDLGIGTDKSVIYQAFREMQGTFIDIPIPLYSRALEALLRAPFSSQDLRNAVELLESFSVRGHDAALRKFRFVLQDSILRTSSEAAVLGVRYDAFSRVDRLLKRLFDPPDLEEDIAMMRHCAGLDKWDAMWEVWHSFPAAMFPRTKEVYFNIFHLTAQRQHQAEAMRCLRECVPEMEMEEPPVPIDQDLAEAIQTCLYLAEPETQRIAAKEDAFGEWASLWRQCERAKASRN